MLSSNRRLAELLAAAAVDADTDQRRRALKRAARAALTWQVEARELADSGQSLEALPRVGPWIARVIEGLGDTGEPPDPLCAGFLSWTDVSQGTADLEAALRGDLQSHSTWSDGHSTLEEMADSARLRGYEYLLATDHTKGLRIANGMDETRLAAQAEEIALLNARGSVRILRGVEMNISPEGDGDMEPEALERLDVILGAFHGQLRRTEDQTERYLSLLRNPYVDVLAHPRGRIWNMRLGLTADWETVFTEAYRLDKAVEADGLPDRQDLNVDLLRLAADIGVRVSFGSDAHHTLDQPMIRFSVGAAYRAGISRDRILNLMPADDLVAWAREHRPAPHVPGRTGQAAAPFGDGVEKSD